MKRGRHRPLLGGTTVSVNVRQVDDCSVVEIEGTFDVGVARWLGGALARLFDGEPGARVVLDLSGVPVVEPRAARAVRSALHRPDVRLAIVNERLSARRIIRRSSGGALLVFATVPAAIEALAPMAMGAPADPAGFRHEALLYAGRPAFLDAVLPVLEEGVAADEPTLVGVSSAKGRMLREHVGDTDLVTIVEIDEVGRNPAVLIPTLQTFVDANLREGRPVRAVGETIWPERSPAEVAECQRHESLLNVAFADTPPWWLLCIYDTEGLDDAVVEEAHRSHPYLLERGIHRRSAAFAGGERSAAPFDEPLPPPPAGAAEHRFDAHTAGEAARVAARHAARSDLSAPEIRDLALAVAEVVENAVAHGGGAGCLRVWQDGGSVVCEVSDAGSFTDPLAGRVRPADRRDDRRGLWFANQVCDLVQIRSSDAGTVVRLHRRHR